jgi:hypothetical protein
MRFGGCKRKSSDIGISDGRYRIARGNHIWHSVWDGPWYYYTVDEHNGQVRLATVQLGPQDRSADSQGVPLAATATPPSEPEASKSIDTEYKHLHEWGLPGHPGNVKPTYGPVPLLVLGPEMPPLSHILRFYTSVVTVLVHPDTVCHHFREEYRLLVPGTEIELAKVGLDSAWSGIGKTHRLVYIARWCAEYSVYDETYDHSPERLHLLLIEDVPGWDEVKSRVQLVQYVSLLDWRKANPRWELVSLA